MGMDEDIPSVKQQQQQQLVGVVIEPPNLVEAFAAREETASVKKSSVISTESQDDATGERGSTVYIGPVCPSSEVGSYDHRQGHCSEDRQTVPFYD